MTTPLCWLPNMQNYETVKIFASEKFELNQYDSATRKYQASRRRRCCCCLF